MLLVIKYINLTSSKYDSGMNLRQDNILNRSFQNGVARAEV